MTETTQAKPKRARVERVQLSAVVNTIANKKGLDATATGKRVRAYIRSHDADLRKTFKWPPEAKERADGNRYPEMPRACATALVERFTK